MELEEMKTRWQEMSVELEKQKKLTDSLIIKMTQVRYKNKISKLLLPEAIGTLICFAAVLCILINFKAFNTWYLLLCSIVSASILLCLPVLSLKAIFKMRSLATADKNYKQLLLQYAKAKMQFVFVQKLSFYLTAVLMLVLLPVMGQLIGGKNFFIEARLWLWYAIGFPFFYAFARWVFKSYNKMTADAENILKELDA